MVVEQPLQSLRVAAVVRMVGARHQQGKVLLFRVVTGKVRVNAPCDFAKQRLETRRRVKLNGLLVGAKCGFVGFLRSLPRFLRTLTRGVRVVQIDFTLGNTCRNLVQLRIKNADTLEIAPFKCLQLSANLCNVGFALGKRGADGSQPLALFGETCGVGTGLKDNFGWHKPRDRAAFSLNRPGILPEIVLGSIAALNLIITTPSAVPRFSLERTERSGHPPQRAMRVSMAS